MNDKMDDATIYSRLKDKLANYSNVTAAKEWLEKNFDQVSALFNDTRIRGFVFEPIKEVFELGGTSEANDIRAAITRVAVANMVLAGLPGKMGVGVLVSMGLELWMAFVIAQRVGMPVRNLSDVVKYFSLLAAIVGVVLMGIRVLLGAAFSAFSVLPGINPLILAELLITNLIGVLFWVGFEVARADGSFSIPLKAAARIVDETKNLYQHQYRILKGALSPANLKLMGRRIAAWFSGEIVSDKAQMRGEIFAIAAMGYLLAGRIEEFNGPLGGLFIQSIRDRYPELHDASIQQIADHMHQYDPEELAGVVSMIKGRLFERLIEQHENGDGDEWTAHIYEDQSYPGSDIVFTNDAGDTVEVSLKASDSVSYVENALLRYPDIPIMATDEVAEHFLGDHRVTQAGVDNADMTEITEQNVEQLIDGLQPVSAVNVGVAGVAASTTANLWPFVVAYLRGRISREQLARALEKVLGRAGESLGSRIAGGVLLGPVYAWYLLARGVILCVKAAEGLADSAPARPAARYRLAASYPI